MPSISMNILRGQLMKFSIESWMTNDNYLERLLVLTLSFFTTIYLCQAGSTSHYWVGLKSCSSFSEQLTEKIEPNF